MSEPIAKKGDRVVGVDTHVVLVPSPGGPVPTPTPMAFDGTLQDALSTTFFADHEAVALEQSVANNTPHIPAGGTFQKPPTNKGTVSGGSTTVFADNKAVARGNDRARCCNDPTDQETGHIISVGTVYVG